MTIAPRLVQARVVSAGPGHGLRMGSLQNSAAAEA
jgi:hypothetical protein